MELPWGVLLLDTAESLRHRRGKGLAMLKGAGGLPPPSKAGVNGLGHSGHFSHSPCDPGTISGAGEPMTRISSLRFPAMQR